MRFDNKMFLKLQNGKIFILTFLLMQRVKHMQGRRVCQKVGVRHCISGVNKGVIVLL